MVAEILVVICALPFVLTSQGIFLIFILGVLSTMTIVGTYMVQFPAYLRTTKNNGHV